MNVDTDVTLSQTSPGFNKSTVFWKHCGKRRNCSKWAISRFPSAFSTRLKNFLPFSSVKIVVCKLSVWESQIFVVCERVKHKSLLHTKLAELSKSNAFAFDSSYWKLLYTNLAQMTEYCLQKGRNRGYQEQERKSWLLEFSLFLCDYIFRWPPVNVLVI